MVHHFLVSYNMEAKCAAWSFTPGTWLMTKFIFQFVWERIRNYISFCFSTTDQLLSLSLVSVMSYCEFSYSLFYVKSHMKQFPSEFARLTKIHCKIVHIKPKGIFLPFRQLRIICTAGNCFFCVACNVKVLTDFEEWSFHLETFKKIL